LRRKGTRPISTISAKARTSRSGVGDAFFMNAGGRLDTMMGEFLLERFEGRKKLS
jgi:hypothetical protein